MVDEANWPDMERAYIQVSGRKRERGHALNIAHMEEAIREVKNKNSGEIAIKNFGEFRFSESIGISKQVDAMSRMVDEFFPEEMTIKTHEYDAHVVKTEKTSYTNQLKDAFCLVKIFERLPELANKGYKGKIRELLLPSLENLSLFNIRTFVDGLKQFEEKWTMFEVKDKPAAPAGNAQANMALKKGGKGINDLPPGQKRDRKTKDRDKFNKIHNSII